MEKGLLHIARQWVLEAGHIIKEKMKEPLTIDTKSDPNDLVTSLDQETEKFFAKKIRNHYPEHILFGEEGYGDEITSLVGTVWIIDPIDGTINFVHQKSNFCISVGIYKDGIGEIGIIYNVMTDDLYTAERNKGAFKNGNRLKPLKKVIKMDEVILGMNHFLLCENNLVDYKKSQSLVREIRGVRSYGSAALQLAYVAEGILDGYLALRLSPWDVAAGMLIVNEVGGITTNLEGNPLSLLEQDSLLTCNEKIHNELIKRFT